MKLICDRLAQLYDGVVDISSRHAVWFATKVNSEKAANM